MLIRGTPSVGIRLTSNLIVTRMGTEAVFACWMGLTEEDEMRLPKSVESRPRTATARVVGITPEMRRGRKSLTNRGPVGLCVAGLLRLRLSGREDEF